LRPGRPRQGLHQGVRRAPEELGQVRPARVVGHHQDYGDDWYYVRAASIARKVYLRPGIGMGQLQKWYGGSYRRGARTEHFRKASSGVIRSVLLQLEEMKVVEKLGAGGRQMTVVGQQDLDRIAGTVIRAGEDDDE
jgi:small subunit ribosomal protein S19e